MTIQEAIDLLQEMLKCKNGDCDPRLCGECDLCQKKRDEIDEVWEMAIRSLEAWENLEPDMVMPFGNTSVWVYSEHQIKEVIAEIEKGGSDNGGNN